MSKHSFILSPRNRTFSIYFGKNDNWPRWAAWVNKCDTSPFVLPRFSSENRKHSKYFQQKCGYGIAEKANGLEFMTHHSLYFTDRWINRWEREREELVLVVTQNQEISAFILNPAMTLGLPLDPQSDGNLGSVSSMLWQPCLAWERAAGHGLHPTPAFHLSQEYISSVRPNLPPEYCLQGSLKNVVLIFPAFAWQLWCLEGE